MRRQTVFCVQTYKRYGQALTKAVLMQFTSASEAEEVALALVPNSAAVVVYALSGVPDADVWDEPELFAAYGEDVRAA